MHDTMSSSTVTFAIVLLSICWSGCSETPPTPVKPESFTILDGNVFENGQPGMSLRTTVAFSFSSPYASDSANLSLISVSHPARFKFVLNAEPTGTILEIAPEQDWDPGTVYHIQIQQGFKGKNGMTLAAGYVILLVTPLFHVVSTSPADGSVDVHPYYSRAVLHFNDQLDTTTVRSGFDLTPAVQGNYVIGEESPPYGGVEIVFTPDTGFASNTVYTISVNRSLRTIGGHTMTNPYVFTFKTGSQLLR